MPALRAHSSAYSYGDRTPVSRSVGKVSPPYLIDLTYPRDLSRCPLRLLSFLSIHPRIRHTGRWPHTKSFGSLNSSTRTADQTETAFFWFIEAPVWIRITNTVLRQEHADVWQSARVLALVNFAIVDGFIACFEAKYHFRFWRPYTAIRRANEDKNSLTEPDSSWLPLLWQSPDVIPPTFFIPPIPEYPSAAAVTSAAAAEVLIQNFDDDIKFLVTSPSLPNVIRKFRSFTQAAREAGMSRVYGGIHFRHSVDDGYKQGRGIGRDIARMLPPINQR